MTPERRARTRPPPRSRCPWSRRRSSTFRRSSPERTRRPPTRCSRPVPLRRRRRRWRRAGRTCTRPRRTTLRCRRTTRQGRSPRPSANADDDLVPGSTAFPAHIDLSSGRDSSWALDAALRRVAGAGAQFHDRVLGPGFVEDVGAGRFERGLVPAADGRHGGSRGGGNEGDRLEALRVRRRSSRALAESVDDRLANVEVESEAHDEEAPRAARREEPRERPRRGREARARVRARGVRARRRRVRARLRDSAAVERRVAVVGLGCAELDERALRRRSRSYSAAGGANPAPRRRSRQTSTRGGASRWPRPQSVPSRRPRGVPPPATTDSRGHRPPSPWAAAAANRGNSSGSPPTRARRHR